MLEALLATDATPSGWRVTSNDGPEMKGLGLTPSLLVGMPLAWVILFLIGDLGLWGGSAHPVFLRAEIELVKLASLGGFLAAALAFRGGEYLRRAWLLSGGCMAFLLLRDVTLIPWFESLPLPLEAVRGGLVVAANAFQVVGMLLLARAWRVAGLEPPVTRARRLGLYLAAALVALAIAGPAVLQNLRALVGGELGSLVFTASGLGDIVSMVLIAPLLLTALSLRGGLLGWPWWLLTASMLGWLLYDAALVALPAWGAGERIIRTVSEAFRALGGMYGLTAGVAQAWVVHRTRARIAGERPETEPVSAK
jgi:hypothetical protein